MDNNNKYGNGAYSNGPAQNRLHLNFGNNDRFGLGDRNAYPTTPSTFPQPVFPAGQQQTQMQSQQHPTSFAPTGYFMNNGYSQPYAPQQQSGQYRPLQQTQATGAYLPRPANASNDPTNNLAHQLSHQNLGDAARTSPYNARGPSPSHQRPRTAGSSAQQAGYRDYHSSPMPSVPVQPSGPEFQPVPKVREPGRYGPKATSAQKRCSQMAQDFFRDSVKRARERNVRHKELEEYLSRTANPDVRAELWAKAGQKEARFLRFLRTKDKPENYQTMKIIGKGAFGEVKLVQKKKDGQVYAMKSLVKTEMFKKDQLAHVRAERDILAESDSEWVVKLFTTFQDENFLYMLMEFLPGGDLMSMLIKYEIFSEDITRFYIAEIVLAIAAVHKLNFIHRDIKPDNILLDSRGHIKLTDFGLSTGFHKLHDNSYYQQLLQNKPAASRARDRMSVNLDQINLTVSNRKEVNEWRKSRRVMAYSTVGTPDYIAPEIFSGQGYTFDCDWWSLGTIMFECMVGWPPFCAEEAHDTYRKIVNWRTTLGFPDDIRLGAEAEHLIRSLICNTEQRLGRGGAHEIQNHPFFYGVNWDTLRDVGAPFKPHLTGKFDTTNFPIHEIDQTDNATHLQRMKAQQGLAGQHVDDSDELSLPFIGYTFKRFSDFN